MQRRLPRWGNRKVSNREFLNKNLKPVRGKVLLPKFGAISALDKELASKYRTWCDIIEEQVGVLTGNIGEDFKATVGRVFGKGVERIFFPAVYVGRVAKALSEAGFGVVCSDVQETWVENAREMGLEAFHGSAEEFPKGRVDLAVSFEPYPLYHKPAGYLFMLETMVRAWGFVEINVPMQKSPELIFTRGLRSMISVSNCARNVFSSYGCFEKEAERDLKYATFRVTREARDYAKLDLAMVRVLGGAGKVSIGGVAEEMGRGKEEIENSIARIVRVVYWAYNYYAVSRIVEDGVDGPDVYDLGGLRLLRLASGIRDLQAEDGVVWGDVVHEVEVAD